MTHELIFFIYYFISLYAIIILAFYALKLRNKLEDARKIIEDLESHSEIEEEDLKDLAEEDGKK